MRTIGPYVVLEEIARGGMGVVFKALGPDGGPVAVKLLVAGTQASAQQRQRFLREVQALRRLDHRSVVRYLDAGEVEGAPFLVMEWIAGESLQARLDRGPLDPLVAVELVRRLAVAIEHCHGRGVLHRDLKPANVLLRPGPGGDEPLLTDFGLARDLSPDAGQRLSRTGVFLGTPGYWSPEQARGDLGAIGPRSDVFGLGALLHALLVGKAPFEGSDLVDSLQAVQRPALPPGALRPGIPRALDVVCARCLDLDPAGRYPSARALAEDLARIQRGEAALGGGRERALVPWLVAGLLLAALLAGVLPLAFPTSTGEPVAPPQVPPPPAPKLPGPGLLAEAWAAWRSERQARALELVRAAAASESSPARAAAHLLEGQLQLFHGAPKETAAAGSRALPELSDPAEQALARALIAAGKGKGDETLAALEEAIRLRPDDLRAFFMRGIVLSGVGDSSGSVLDFTRVLELDAGFVPALVARADMLRVLGELERAWTDYSRALELNPDSYRALDGRGSLRERRGDRVGAIEDYTRALEIDPDLVVCRYNRGLARRQNGDAEGAIEDLSRAVELDPQDGEALNELGLAHELRGDHARAIEVYDQALRLRPQDPAVLANRGWARAGMGSIADGIADAEQALALVDPSSPDRERIERMLTIMRAGR